MALLRARWPWLYRIPTCTPKPKPAPTKRPPKKLSYQEQKEWEGIEAAILAAEEAAEARRAAAEDPAVATDAGELHRRTSALAAALAEVERLYARWAELEAKRSGLPVTGG